MRNLDNQNPRVNPGSINFRGVSGKKFCVVGDMIVDYYRFVSASKLSPEAPVVIFRPESEEFRPGGAGNVANNLSALGARKVFLCSIVGEDYDDNFAASMPFVKPIDRADVICQKEFIVSSSRLTTVKERIVTTRQQIARIDKGPAKHPRHEISLHHPDEEAFLSRVLPRVEESDAVIISDYAHGVMSEQVAHKIIHLASRSGVPVVVDSKAKDSLRKYTGCSVFMPNLAEARSICNDDSSSEMNLILDIRKKIESTAVAITMGTDGILVAVDDKSLLGGFHVRRFPPLPGGEVVDVTGAGDTAAATVALGLALKMPYDDAMRLSQAASGVVVRKLGTATTSISEVEAAMDAYVREEQGHG